MAKLTLLEMTQDILNDIDGDEVGSIDDTIESVQVAQIIKSTYLALISNRNWPHTRKLVQFSGSGDTTHPTSVIMPDNCKEIIFVKYNCTTTSAKPYDYQEIKYVDPDNFLRFINGRNSLADNVQTVVDPTSSIPLLIRNDTVPTKFTSFDDINLVFDAFNSTVDDSLQTSKFQCYIYTMPAWEHTDSAIPDLPEEAFVSLLEEAKSKAAAKLRQQADQKAEQESVRQRKWLARKDWVVAGGIKFPNYGRGRGGSPYKKDPTFRRDN